MFFPVTLTVARGGPEAPLPREMLIIPPVSTGHCLQTQSECKTQSSDVSHPLLCAVSLAAVAHEQLRLREVWGLHGDTQLRLWRLSCQPRDAGLCRPCVVGEETEALCCPLEG